MRYFAIFIFASLMVYSCNPGTGGSTGTVTSPGGHEYIIFKKGTGEASAPGDLLTFELYQFVDDSLIVSTRKMGRPQQFQVPAEGKVLSKEEDIMSTLVVGDSVRISIGLDTMKQRPPGFENNKFIHLDFMVTEKVSEAEFKQQQEEKRLEAEKLRAEGQIREKEVAASIGTTIASYTGGSLANIQTHPTGLKYVIHEQGTGKKPENGQRVDVNYYGALTDGSMFDNSFGRGEAFQFMLGQGQVIRGWDVGVPLLNEGGKATLFIPYDMAYGEAGRPPQIPAKSELVFYVELNKVL